MKILEHGTSHQIITCSKCKCKFSYCNKDIKNYSTYYADYYISYNYINCPECDNSITLEHGSIEI